MKKEWHREIVSGPDRMRPLSWTDGITAAVVCARIRSRHRGPLQRPRLHTVNLTEEDVSSSTSGIYETTYRIHATDVVTQFDHLGPPRGWGKAFHRRRYRLLPDDYITVNDCQQVDLKEVVAEIVRGRPAP